MSITNLEITLRLILALFLGGLIGLERESIARPAGFRTHILVATGSALIMMVSMYAFSETLAGSYDPGRIAAQVVSGIGFLGAGTIMREGVNVQGLTTAASLWTVAGIGLAVGAGFYFPAVLGTVLAALTLLFLGKVGWSHMVSRHKILTVILQDVPGQLASIFAVLAKYKVDVLNIDLSPQGEGDAKLKLKVELSLKASKIDIIAELCALPGIRKASYSQE